MAGRLAGKHALVTGGTQGIGEGIVREFVAQGARVVTVARHPDRAAELVRELAPELTVQALDITDERAWERLVAYFDSDPFDVLVNNAGGLRFAKPLVELSPAEWRSEIELNLTGPFLAMHSVLPSMLRRGSGSIINIGSMSGVRAQPDASAYQASKAGLRWLTKNAAITYARDGIRINAINPGVIATEKPLSGPSAREKLFLGRVPVGRRGLPSDIALAAVYLASDESTYVTGIDLQVDGGYEM
jgi:3alpha(or 20beta)-hydroxysteroid dehydrogenase